MTWMLTATGAMVDLQIVQPRSISLLDIAHHLAQINRFHGACNRPYSVAEHSLLVERIMRQHLGITAPTSLFAGLMHDAHEAYCNDVSSPWKATVGQAWAIQELRLQAQVLNRFRISTAFAAARDEIHDADQHALTLERQYLLPANHVRFASEASHPAPAGFERAIAEGDDRQWWEWRERFLERAAELRLAIDNQLEALGV